MRDSPSLEELVANANSIADVCFKTNNVDQYDTLNQLIHEIDGLARETIQARLMDDLLRIAAKLEAGGQPSAHEEELIEVLIIGAASQYVTVENNVADWKAELQRLLAAINDAASDPADVDTLLRVRALCRDASGVLPDLRHWLAELARIQRFKDAAASDDPERGPVLASFIRGALASSRH